MRLEIIVCLLFAVYVHCQSNSTQKIVQATSTTSTTRSSSSSSKYDFANFVSKYKKLPLVKNRSVFSKISPHQRYQKNANRSFESIFKLSKLGREPLISTKTANISNSKKLNRSKVKVKSNKNLKTTSSKIPISKGIYQIKSIYNNFKNGKAVLNDKSINTIRYIPSVKVDSTKKLYFLFNLSLISGSETVIKSDLFINRKYVKQRLEFNMHYFLYSSGTKRNSSSANQKVNRDTSAGGTSATIYLKNLKQDKSSNQYIWQSFNIIDSVKSYLTIRNSRKLLENAVNKSLSKNIYFTYNNNAQISSSSSSQLDELVLIMEATNYKSRKSNSKNLADTLNPYLIVYSKEKETNMKKFFQSRMPNILQETKSSKPDDSVPFRTSEDELSQLKKFENQVDKQNESFDSNESSDFTTAKSVQIASSNEINKTNVSLNLTAKLSSIESYLIEKSKQNDPYFNYLPRSKRDLKARRLTPSFEDAYEEDDIASGNVFEDSNRFGPNIQVADNETKNKITKCDKQSITIDFEDMSFSDWIVEPKRFPSNYCSGACKFPLDQKISYSNYATLQSILNSISLNNRNTPPELCCSPSTTDSLPILYVDKNSIDYVVKLLPDMVVKDCSCR